MKKIGMLLIVVAVLMGRAAPVSGGQETEQGKASPVGDAKRGEVLFNKPLVLGNVPISCATCHPKGRGLEKSYGKQEFTIFGYKAKRIEAVVDFLIINVLQGKGLKYNSQEMADLKAYMKALFLADKPEWPLQTFVPLEGLDVDQEPRLYGE